MKKQIVSLKLVLVLAFSSAFAQWVPADSSRINTFPYIPFLPEPLVMNEGGKSVPIVNNQQWEQKREWIKTQYQYWISGSVPPAPKTFKHKIISEFKENGVTLRTVQLSFGPGDRAKMTVELMIPPANKRLPVFMTQANHRGWAQIAVRRGYIGCVYAGADNNDDTRNYAEVFPGFDFATLMKRAWGGSRVLDYLVTLPEVDTAAIALTGHSRNGKQSLMEAAFDTRIKAVVSSSGGTGGESAFRFSDERFNSESVEEITRNFPYWFVSRLRLFTGQENKLPVDQNLLMSLIAPRGLMLVSAITEGQGNPWGVEQSYRSVEKVYHFMHADSKLAILLRPGRHQHAAREVEDYLDFFDYIFGRSARAPENRLYSGYSFEGWKKSSHENVNITAFAKNKGLSKDTIRQRIKWLLGEEPPEVLTTKALSAFLTKNSAYGDDYLAEVIGEPSLPAKIKKMEIGPYSPLGENLWGTMYFPATAVTNDSVSTKLPLVIFLHEYAYATGYHRRNIPAVSQFTNRGFAVLSFDFVGHGTRIEEALHFYDRFPHWSLLGKMVADTRAIITDATTRMPFIDSTNIYLAGYSLGGTVALFTAAMDARIKGTAVSGAFSSLQNDHAGTEGLLHFSELHGLLPRLGFYAGREDRLPVDFDQVLQCIAPRSLLVIAPERDRNHSIASVTKIVEDVLKQTAANAPAGWLTFLHPDTYDQFPETLQQQMADWLLAQKNKTTH